MSEKIAVVAPMPMASVSTVVNADFAENGVTFNLGSYELEAYLYGAVSPINGRDPMTPPEAAAWLAGARLLAFRFTPHPYYLPFKTEPFAGPTVRRRKDW